MSALSSPGEQEVKTQRFQMKAHPNDLGLELRQRRGEKNYTLIFRA